MEVVAEELGATLSAVPVKDCKELDLVLWLLVAVRLQSRFLQVKNDRDAIFIVVSDEAIVGVGPIGYHVWREGLMRHLSLLNDGTGCHLTHVLSFQDVRIQFAAVRS